MDARLVVGRKTTNDPGVMVLKHDQYRNAWSRFWMETCRRCKLRPGIARLLGRPLSAIRVLKGEEDFDFPGTQHLFAQLAARADLLHLHVLHGAYFDLRALPFLSHRIPTVVTLHDEWMLTGHCAGSIDCPRWQTGCGSCPDLKRSPSVRRDATAFNWRRKSDIYEKGRLHVVTPSRDLMAKFGKSMLAKAAVSRHVIPHGIDLSVFKTGNREEARQFLGLPKSATILLFSAQGTLDNPYKDFQTLRNALEMMANERAAQNLLVIALGKEASAERLGQIELRFVPYESDRQSVARYYQASDIYVHASKAESWGLAVTEAMACGLPVVASAVGGVPDQVSEGETGFLASPGDAACLAERIARLLGDEEFRRRMGRRGFEKAQAAFGLDRMLDDYLELYEAAMSDAGLKK
jgi:glycosyltransferase involved in cell wall biosynthesis